MRIIIYDTSRASNLVTIGEMQPFSVNRRVAQEDSDPQCGFGLDACLFAEREQWACGRFFFCQRQLTAIASNGCMTKFSGLMIGALGASFFFTNTIVTNIVDLTVTNMVTNISYVISNFTVNVPRTSLAAGGRNWER